MCVRLCEVGDGVCVQNNTPYSCVFLFDLWPPSPDSTPHLEIQAINNHLHLLMLLQLSPLSPVCVEGMGHTCALCESRPRCYNKPLSLS